jgi:hypothetical protein
MAQIEAQYQEFKSADLGKGDDKVNDQFVF